MSKNKQDDHLFEDKIKTGKPDSVLASLFRLIQFELGVTPERFNRLMENYMRNANIPNNLREASSLRGNLKKELQKDTMSWKVFIKALVFLNIKKFKITLELYHENKHITQHSQMIILDHSEIMNDRGHEKND